MIIDEKTKKYIEENWKDLSFYLYEKFDTSCFVSFDEEKLFIDEELLFEDEKEEIMKLLKEMEEPILEFFEWMPKNHTFDIHIQEPSLHKEDIYPLCNSKPRVIVFSEYDENMNDCNLSFNVSDFKEELKIGSYNKLQTILHNLECIASGYRGIEIHNRVTNRRILIDTPSYLLIDKLLDNRNDKSIVEETIYNIFKRQELTILKETYPEFIEMADYIQNDFFRKIFDKIKEEVKMKTSFYEKSPDIIKKWIDTLISLKGDIKNKEFNVWKIFLQNNIDYETMCDIYKMI